jgi:hypothetical protein
VNQKHRGEGRNFEENVCLVSESDINPLHVHRWNSIGTVLGGGKVHQQHENSLSTEASTEELSARVRKQGCIG